MDNYWLENWFSNKHNFDRPMYHCEKVIHCMYPSVEHFYQLMKIENEKERADALQKTHRLSGLAAKKFVRGFPLRADWDRIKKKVMWTALLWKWREGTKWGTYLKNTGHSRIVEYNNWHDNYWGHCVCGRCVDALKFNHLGEMIMKIRRMLIYGKEAI